MKGEDRVNFDLSEEQKLLAEQARGLLAAHAPYDRLRELVDSGAEWDEALWKALCDMGLPGARIPEAYGGLGLTDLDLGVISEELGRANASVPFFSSIVCAADAIAAAGSEAQKLNWLPGLASGEVVAAFASAEGKAGWLPQKPGVIFRNGRLTGAKLPVADAGLASLAVVQCRAEDNEALALVHLDQPGVVRTRLKSFDHLRAHYRIDLNEATAELLPAGGASVISAVMDRAAVQAAFEAVGAAEACVMMGRDYTMGRQMFGRPLASYQAIKHKLADILMATELARSSAYFAAWAANEAPDQLPVAAASARLTSLDALAAAARENLQVHGGIGYTFEANCHFYYRRERTLALTLGPKDYWAARLVGGVRAQANKAA